MGKSTMVELVEELQKLPQTDAIKMMIEEAKAGEYHDYKNVKYDCGKMESSRRLRSLGHIDLAQRIESGEFDETADSEDIARMRGWIDEDPGMSRKQKSRLKEICGLTVEQEKRSQYGKIFF